MSLMRQMVLLLAAVLVLALAGAVGVNLRSARDTLATQARLKNSDNAQSLALALSQQRGDAALIDLLLAAQFDTGFYRQVRLVRADGSVAFERRAGAEPQVAPHWFVQAWPIDAPVGVAQVSDGWRALGRVEVATQLAYAHDDLWRASLQSLAWLGTLGIAAMALAVAGVRRIRRPLDATVAQADALVEGRYLTVPEPAVPELRRVARAMNGMVDRVRRLFEAQAAQVEQLRREAHEDRLTGLPHRAHFMLRLAAMCSEEGAGAGHGSLLLVRVAELAQLNRTLGRERSDAVLRAVSRTLRGWPADGALPGRLNGSDFALALPGVDAALATAQGLAAALRSALEGFGDAVVLHVGAVAWSSGAGAAASPGALLARADLALARAEGGAPFGCFADTTHARDDGGKPAPDASGEQEWHRRLLAALTQQRARLAEFPVVGRDGVLLHLECPLRVQLDPQGDYEPALRWLPLAQRSRLLPALDLAAVRLALAAVAVDGRARAINLALASVADGAFAAQLRELLAAEPQAAASLWLEVGEGAGQAHVELLRAFAALVRPLGVRFGLEHAGHALHRAPRLYELGFDYVKLDASLVRGAAHDEAVRRFAAGAVALLGALPVQVCAEGIDDDADAQALWACGMDAITGPWAR